MNDEELNDLTSEKTLLDVYWKVVRRLPTKLAYRLVVVLAFLLVLGSSLESEATTSLLAKRARDWSSSTFGFASTVLGILLAGFTIFSTLAGTALIGPLARLKERRSGLPYVKFTAGRFMHVFIWYVAFLFVYACVMLFGWEGGPLTQFAHFLARNYGSTTARFSTALGLSLLGAFFVHLLVVLQSFVFNVYASFMFMVRGKLELERAAEGRDGDEKASADAEVARARLAAIPNESDRPEQDEDTRTSSPRPVSR